ncbi:hypothetical protein TRFO_36690 [Tritrichomonas foetus]|uniref:Uncharacterized protein n=1 Tax=Tritrichomonas foetus TaxID=1144522 RepID=A0A1J4JER7_9EUKA|nr:hypothetical protein TRFO_36690 [Tritrichomonas foetus]|eukprot:OHS97161.1 hypothetical protein TRFO_36690 [Tritrichomonas foetus]
MEIEYLKHFSREEAILSLQSLAATAEMIMSIDEYNYEEIKQKIIESEYLNSKLSFAPLLYIIRASIEVRPKSHALYISLLESLSDHIKLFFSSKKVYHIFKRLTSTVFCLYKMGLILFDDLNLSTGQQEQRLIFYKEILERDSEKMSIFDQTNESLFLFNQRTDYNEHWQNCINGCDKHPVKVIIRNDDIDKFIQLLSEQIVKIDDIIQKSIYEDNHRDQTIDQILYKMSLIEYAVMFGSVNIFKFLWLQKVECNKEQMIQYAVESGNSEILFTLEESGVKFTETLVGNAIYYHRNHVAEYLINSLQTKLKCFEFVSTVKNLNYKMFLDLSSLIEIELVNKVFDEYVSIPHIACEKGDFSIIKYLFTINGFNFHRKGEDCDLYPIFSTIIFDHFELFQYLVLTEHVPYSIDSFHKIDVNGIFDVDLIDFDEDEDDQFQNVGKTALHLACKFGRINFIEFLLKENKIDINSADYYELTPLHLAVKSQNVKAIKLLCETPGIDLNARDFKKRTPLLYAILKDDFEIIQYFAQLKDVDWNASDIQNKSILEYSMINLDSEHLKFLLEIEDLDINKRSKNNDHPICIPIISDNFVNFKVCYENKRFCRNILLNGDKTIFQTCVSCNSQTFVHYLVREMKVDINETNSVGKTALHFSVIENNKNSVISLLEFPEIDLNIRDKNGFAPLHYACMNSSIGAQKLIIESLYQHGGLILDAEDNEGMTPFMHTVKHSAYEQCVLLFNYGADINHKNMKGESVTTIALQKNDPKILSLLKIKHYM